ncbi:hypothetical protein Tco_0694763 [Tanacetum coccineum]
MLLIANLTKDVSLVAMLETKISQPLLVVPSPVSSSDDLHLTVREAHIPATVDTESEPEEDPSETEGFEASEPSNNRITSSHSSASSNSTAPLSSDHPLTQTSPTRTSFHRRTTRMAVRVQPAMSPSLLARVTEAMTLSDLAFRESYQGTSKLILDTKIEDDKSEAEGASLESEESKDEGPDLDGEEAALEGQRRALESTEEVAPSTLEVGQSSRLVPDQQVANETPRIPVRTIWIDPEEGVQLELYRSILHDHTQRLDALLPTLFEGYDQDLKELYTRSGARENNDLRMQIAEQRCERLELTGRVARMERRHES